MTVFHVSPLGSDTDPGTSEQPFATIQRGAEAALPGDTVQVHTGVYREWVRPVRGGLSDRRRIVFEAAPGATAVIKGSEVVTGWTNEVGTVWRAAIPNATFGGFNPFAQKVDGDWIVPEVRGRRARLGEVYLNGKSFYEVYSRDAVTTPERRTHANDHWTGRDQPLPDPDQTVYVWYAEVGEEVTTVWANFQGADPNTELVEVNVRRSIFYPEVNHLDYITVRGFEMAQAATPWTPPTADQPGLIGPNWAKGWIIEDNVIHDAKCSAISLGKEARTGHNYAHERNDKPGYQYQLESVFTARRYGWSEETIGSHIVRRNTIFDCGQNGIVGHLGCVFSIIEDNHIHDIATKHEWYGYEIAGIKLHAAIDVQIRHNRIHDTTLGIWLDWQAQGTRLSRNLLYGNGRDLFVEVTHGPYLVDHNVLASPVAFDNFAQGGAFVNNLVAGVVRLRPVMDRATPYHLPHSTEVAGYAFVYGADDRWIGNVFVGGNPQDAFDRDAAIPQPLEEHEFTNYGTAAYNGCPPTFEEYQSVTGIVDDGDHERFHTARQPAYVSLNAYASGARQFDRENDGVFLSESASVSVVDDGDVVYLETTLPAALTAPRVGVVTGAELGRVRIVDADFEDPDGTLVVADVDLLGECKDPARTYPPGPLAALAAGPARVRVW